jgi:putative transcriptional regulator
MTIHDDADRSQIEIVPGVHFTTDREDVEALLREDDEHAKRFLVGYAGWSSEQLEGEIEIGSWLQAPADAKQIFDPGVRQWQKWVTIITGELKVSPDKLPDDPSLN